MTLYWTLKQEHALHPRISKGFIITQPHRRAGELCTSTQSAEIHAHLMPHLGGWPQAPGDSCVMEMGYMGQESHSVDGTQQEKGTLNSLLEYSARSLWHF